ncbi:MAG TPA: hypothetical protein PKO15_13585, partial [Fibrobacteria bacterium]|nr:hypothetical protein [Fibrobacteria bacterium]
LTYWVAARSKDTTTGPIWNKVAIRAASPALNKHWQIDWSSPRQVAGFADPSLSRMDTLASGLVLSRWTNNSDTTQALQMRILGFDGAWSSATIPGIEEMETDPVFWQGKLWIAKGKASSRHFLDTTIGRLSPISTSIFDSVEISSSVDGIHWHSTTIDLRDDSITSFRLNATASEIVLVPCYRRMNQLVGSLSYSRSMLVSSDGAAWSSRPKDSVLTGQDGRPFVPYFWSTQVRPVGPNTTWTLVNDTWIIPGIAMATSQAIFEASGLAGGEKAMVGGDGSHVAISSGRRLLLSRIDSKLQWQHVSAPEFVQAFCFWQGKLVTLGVSGLHFGTISELP